MTSTYLHLKYLFIADNTCLLYANKSYSKQENIINCSLDNIANWLSANKLTLNITKSNFIAFNISKNNKDTPPIHVYILIKKSLSKRIMQNT